jgi:hypothetical protein
MKITFLAFLVFTLVAAGFSHAAMPLHATNDVEDIGDGWYRITGGDPYLVFHTVGSEVSPDLRLEAIIEAKHLPNRHQYIEWFYATEKHGFSEEFKAFAIKPFSATGHALPQVYPLGRFIAALADSSERIDLVRIDFEPELRKTDVQFRLRLRWLEPNEEFGREAAMHPPYLSRFLLKPATIQYTLRHLGHDVLRRVFRDWLFVLLYFPSVLGLSFLIFANRSRHANS